MSISHFLCCCSTTAQENLLIEAGATGTSDDGSALKFGLSSPLKRTSLNALSLRMVVVGESGQC